MKEAAALPADMTVLERGWLSSNSVLLQGDERGALLVDTGYCTHSAQTLELVKAAIAPGSSLRLILNSHFKSYFPICCNNNIVFFRKVLAYILKQFFVIINYKYQSFC